MPEATPSQGPQGSPAVGSTPLPNGGGALVPVQRRVVTWDPQTGFPVVESVPMFTKAQMTDIIAAELAQPYEPVSDDPLHPDQEFVGLTNYEVMMRKRVRTAARSGSTEESEALLDRVMGRPKQSSENVSVKVGYEDYIKELARKEGAKAPQPHGENRPSEIPAEAMPFDDLFE